jgi:hypothetical protein
MSHGTSGRHNAWKSERAQPPARVFAVVLNYRSAEATLTCVAHLRRVAYPHFSILIVDNCSADGSCAVFQRELPDIPLLVARRNRGYGAGNNVGIRWALKRGADLMWIISPDTGVAPNALVPLVERMREDPRVGVCGSVIHAGEACVLSSCLDPRNGFKTAHRTCRESELAGLDLPPAVDTDYVDGCAMLLRRELVEEIGLFRVDFFLYYEEAEFCLRARSRGWKVQIVPRSHVYTRPMSEERNNRSYYMIRNSVLLARVCRRHLARTLLRHATTAYRRGRYYGRRVYRPIWDAVMDGLRAPIRPIPTADGRGRR